MAQIFNIEDIRAERTIRTVLKLMREEFNNQPCFQKNLLNQNVRNAFELISDAARTSQKYTRTEVDEGLAYLADQFKIAQ